jgi:GT2 family glycosyltransferase
MPHDKDFFSIFQSVYVNYSETKKNDNPDYIAAHAMIIDALTFRKSGGFPEVFLPIIEDVEFSHRLRRSGCRLIMDPGIQVRHIFNFSLVRSLRNAFKKSAYWNMYSLKNRDLLADSGTASLELKTDVASYCLNLVLLLMWGLTHKNEFLIPAVFILIVNMYVNRRLFKSFFETKGGLFAGLAALYYIVLYPVPIVMGTITGMMKHLLKR